MTRELPRIDRTLLFLQGVGAAGLAIAWAGSSASQGWPGVAIAVAGLAGILGTWAFRSLGASFRIAPTPRAGASLVRSGIYRWVRHPMYVSVALVAVAAGLARPSFAVITIAILNIALYVAKARYEERLLVRHYQEYAGYRHHMTRSLFSRGQKSEGKP